MAEAGAVSTAGRCRQPQHDFALAGEGLDVALAGAARAGWEGMEATREMLAATGKARPLGERARGHVDPGALSTFLILEAMAEYVGPT